MQSCGRPGGESEARGAGGGGEIAEKLLEGLASVLAGVCVQRPLRWRHCVSPL